MQCILMNLKTSKLLFNIPIFSAVLYFSDLKTSKLLFNSPLGAL